jgi:hypothetical protein
LAGFLAAGFFFKAFFVRGGGADERSTFGLYDIESTPSEHATGFSWFYRRSLTVVVYRGSARRSAN